MKRTISSVEGKKRKMMYPLFLFGFSSFWKPAIFCLSSLNWMCPHLFLLIPSFSISLSLSLLLSINNCVLRGKNHNLSRFPHVVSTQAVPLVIYPLFGTSEIHLRHLFACHPLTESNLTICLNYGMKGEDEKITLNWLKGKIGFFFQISFKRFFFDPSGSWGTFLWIFSSVKWVGSLSPLRKMTLTSDVADVSFCNLTQPTLKTFKFLTWKRSFIGLRGHCINLYIVWYWGASLFKSLQLILLQYNNDT